jgi:hypothetical protein
MLLRKHRDDVKDLRLQGDNHIQAIAARYQRLVVAYEAYLEYITALYGPTYSVKEKRVLKDAEGKK